MRRALRGTLCTLLTTVLVGAVATAPAQAATDRTVTGLITDRATGTPVPDACVTVYTTAATAVGQGCAGPDGSYQLTGLPSNTPLKARVEAAGYSSYWYGDAISFAAGIQLQAPAINFRLYVGGTIRGRVVDPQGSPVGGLLMVVERASAFVTRGTVRTDSQGDYVFAGLLPDDYKVQVQYGSMYQWQWYPQANSKARADAITVVSSGDQVRDMALLPPSANAAITVIDGTTRQPVTHGCVAVGSQQDCSPQGGTFHLTALPLGVNTFVAHPEPTNWPSATRLDLWAGDNDVTLTVRHARTIRTRLVAADDPTRAVTGCVYVVPAALANRLGSAPVSPTPPAYQPDIEANPASCAAPDGTVEIGPLGDADVNLFVMPDAPYGAQWVAAIGGGTGDQRQAKRVRPTETTQLAPLPMDRGGAVAGQVLRGSGGCVSPVAPNAYSVRIPVRACVSTGGGYRLDNLGPYDWPVYFSDPPPALHYPPTYLGVWYGGSTNRFEATPVHVTAGATRSGVDGDPFSPSVTVPVFMAYSTGNAAIEVYDVTTGDLLSTSTASAADGGFLAPTRKVMVRWVTSGGLDCWLTSAPVGRLGSTLNPIMDLSSYHNNDIAPKFYGLPGSNCVAGPPGYYQNPPRRGSVPRPTGTTPGVIAARAR